MLLAIVGPKTTYLHKVSLSFTIGEKEMLFFFGIHTNAVLKFHNRVLTKYLEVDEAHSTT